MRGRGCGLGTPGAPRGWAGGLASRFLAASSAWGGRAKCCSHRHVTAACTGWRAKMAKGALGSLASLPTMGVLGTLQIQDPTSGSTAPLRRKKPVKLRHAPAASPSTPPQRAGMGEGGGGGPAATLWGAQGGRGFSARVVSSEAEESAQCPNRSIQSLLKIAKCVPGGGGSGLPGLRAALAAWPRAIH